MQKYILIIALIALCVGGFIGYSMKERSFGQAPSGIQAAFATSTAATAATTEAQLFATSTNCSARVVSTTNAGILLTFSERNSVRPTAAGVGHWQPASTTVNYDAGVFGCDAWHVLTNGTASSNITIAEFR